MELNIFCISNNLIFYRNISELNIDYLKVAKASEFCSSYFSALFYSELWCQSKIKEMQEEDEKVCERRSSMIDIIYERQGQEVGEALQNLLRNVRFLRHTFFGLCII